MVIDLKELSSILKVLNDRKMTLNKAASGQNSTQPISTAQLQYDKLVGHYSQLIGLLTATIRESEQADPNVDLLTALLDMKRNTQDIHSQLAQSFPLITSTN